MSARKPDNMDKHIKQWDCSTAPPAFALYQSIKQYLRMYYYTPTDSPIDSEKKLDDLMNLLSTRNGREVLNFYDEHGATYPKELVKALNIKASTVKERINAITRIGFIQTTAKLERTSGGRIPFITSLVVAGPEYTIKAQARFDHSQGISSNASLDLYMDENADFVKQQDEHQAKEEAEARRQDVIALVKGQYLKQFKADGQGVSVQKIHDSVMREGFSYSEADDIQQEIAQLLEEAAVPTVIQIADKSTPSYPTVPAFIEIRKRRDTNG